MHEYVHSVVVPRPTYNLMYSEKNIFGERGRRMSAGSKICDSWAALLLEHKMFEMRVQKESQEERK